MKSYVCLGIVFLGLLGGCTTLNTVRTDYDPQQDFTRLKHWNWLPSTHKKTPVKAHSLIGQRIHDAVADELTKRGYAISKHPDFYVDYHIVVKEKRNAITRIQPYGGYTMSYAANPPYQWTPAYATAYTHYYQENSLFIRITQASTHNVVWNGFVSLSNIKGDTPEQRLQKVKERVHSLLDRFPPKAQSAQATRKKLPATNTDADKSPYKSWWPK